MPVTNYGRIATAWRIGSDTGSIGYFGIGTGSGTGTAVNVTLVNETSKFLQTGSPGTATAQKITFTGDRNSVQMSGTLLTEFGLFSSGAANTGSLWVREAFPSITFDGSNELRILYTIAVN